MTMPIERAVADVVAAREAGRLDDALELALALVGAHPDDAQANLQCAWTLDRLGEETKAVGYYQRAIDLGLPGMDAQLRAVTQRTLKNWRPAADETE